MTNPPVTKKNPSEQDQRPIRPIRSFVHRRSHVTPGQRRALETLAPRWAIPFQPQPLALAEPFAREAATILEIGSGMGEATLAIAQQRPDENFIAVEVYDAGVGALLRHIDEAQCQNLRIIQHDAVEVLQTMIPLESLAGVHIFFPDPWPKKRHHKRRLIQPPFVELLAQRLQIGGYVHCATDWADYAEQMLEVLSQNPKLQNRYTDFAPRPDYRPLTKFEQRGLRLGHGVWDLIFVRQ